MVRKGNQQKSSVDRKAANGRVSEPLSWSEEREKSKDNGQYTGDGETGGRKSCKSSSTCGEKLNETSYVGGGKKNKQRQRNTPCSENSGVAEPTSASTAEPLNHVQNAANSDSSVDANAPRGDSVLPGRTHNQSFDILRGLSLETLTGHIRPSAGLAGQKLRVLSLDFISAAKKWHEQLKPWLSLLNTYICKGLDYTHVQIKLVFPVIRTWVLRFWQLVFLLFVLWLDCNIRGLDSLVRMNTTSLFAVVWCSVLSLIAMVGFIKVFIFMVISAALGAVIGLALGIFVLAIFAGISLWLYGSFWTTSLIIFIGGATFALSHERIALLVASIYSVYCAKSYVGWLGLLLGLNLSFLSSDILAYFLKNSMNEQESQSSPEQNRRTQSETGHFDGEPSHSSPAEDDSASRSSGIPSTSGCDAELTSEGEVLRLLNCSDHYSALGFTRFENVDVSLLKREYRKKAMLVHPDKNMGNEKAAEAFKKLQNAYEVLLDSLKRKTYDDELRREELLNYFRRFQSASQKNGKHNMFDSGTAHFEAEDEGSYEGSRTISCKKCGGFHRWTRTERSRSRARWCQDCDDFHPAKDGDGWLEQSLQPFLFGLLHKVDAPCVYVCAEGTVYDATKWFICQGMRCPANTHKPGFQVNTTLSSKNSPTSKGAASSSQRGPGSMPNSKVDESMTEEEFFEWLHNAMQSGVFETRSGPTSESPSAKSGGSSKGGSSSSAKKKRKGKKQW